MSKGFKIALLLSPILALLGVIGHLPESALAGAFGPILLCIIFYMAIVVFVFLDSSDFIW